MTSARQRSRQPTTAPPKDHRTGSRRRGDELVRAIFVAALEELAATSFEELSFDKIAARAGTGKAALYRRWSTTAELVLAALSDPATGFPEPSPPETGSLREDLIAVLSTFARCLDEPRGRALQPLLTQSRRHPELFDEVFRTLILPNQKMLVGVVRAGAARAEADHAAVTQRVASVGPRLIIAESMQRDSVPHDEVAAIVDEVLLPLTAPRTA